ncbi:MAG: 3-deoxy-D-manno-octulosonic acid transferase [Candidatus Omnitrophota bacterium]
MRFIYNIFFIIFSIVYLPYLIIKSKGHKDFLQKFGFLPDKVKNLKNPLWIHAVSVGEAVLAAKLAVEITSRFKDISIVVSTTTKTGNDMIKRMGLDAVDAVFYYPLDLGPIVSLAVRTIKPSLYVMIETELWPNLLEEFYREKIPVILANGRISDKSFNNYKSIRFITRRILKCIDTFCVRTKEDEQRIIELGAPSDRIVVTGNMKFEERIPNKEEAVFLRELAGFDDKDEVIVAGSTHYPEEALMLDIYKELKSKREKLKLILVPRHVDRTEKIRQDLEKKGLKCSLFSGCLEKKNCFSGTDEILLVDTIGHLKALYNIASVVFIGGSFVKKGGQNPIEAALWGKPVVFGPHMFNFKEIAAMFVKSGAAIQVKDVSELKKTLVELLDNPCKREEMARSAANVISMNSGAVKKTADVICKVLNGE